mgnify:FL=1
MKNNYLFKLLFISSLIGSESVESKIDNFFSSVNDKTINLIVLNQEKNIPASLSIDNNVIFFDTIDFDSTVTKIQNNSIFTYDLKNERLIIENSEENFLNFFYNNNFKDYYMINKSIIRKTYRVIYSNNINTLEIDFDEELDKVSKIKLIQDKNIFFDVKILDVLEFNDPIKNLILTNDWKTIDWRVE